MSGRVVILGLDGGTWRVFDKFVAAGHMPNLSGLLERGHRADLMSTVPPITPVAWSSVATGMNPGKHGVFGFMSARDDPGSYSPPPARSTAVRRPTFWRAASDAGRRTVVLSVPLTYPAEPVNGYMVTGMFTPEGASGCTHPPELRDLLERSDSMPKFQLDFTRRRQRGRGEAMLERALSGGADDYFRDLDDTQDRLMRATRLLSKEPWDLVMAVLIGTDRLQHVLWDEVDAYDEAPDSPMSRRIAAFYRRTDEAIGEFARLAGDGHLLLMSDHGFGPCAGRFAVGRWLVDNGYSRYKARPAYHAAHELADRLGVKHLARRMLRGKAVSRAIRSEFIPLDWERSRAYFASGTYGIRINLRGREARGIVEPGGEYESLRAEILERTLAATDPVSGGRVFSNAWFSNELYEGPEVGWAPDIVLEPDPGPGYALIAGDPGRPELVLPSRKSRGSHRPEGVLLLTGPSVRRTGGRSIANIVDIAPTVLRLLGLHVPPDMDGRALSEALETLPDPAELPFAQSGAHGHRGSTGGYSDDEEGEVRERLRNLGYID